MLMLPAGLKIFVANEPLDMRKSFTGIASALQARFQRQATSGHLYVFHNRRGDKIKLFYWDRNGFVQWYKQLEQGRFRFPRHPKAMYEISNSDLALLLEGIDLLHQQRLRAY